MTSTGTKRALENAKSHYGIPYTRGRLLVPAFAAIFSDTNQVRRWLDVERALAATQAEMGIIPHEAAREIDRAAQVERFDLTQLGRESLETGHLLVPTIRALARSCEGSWGSTCTMA